MKTELEDSTVKGWFKRNWPALVWTALLGAVLYCWSHTGTSC